MSKSSKPSLVTPNIPKGQKPHFQFNNVISADLVHFHCLCFAYYLPLDNGNSLWLSILPSLLSLSAHNCQPWQRLPGCLLPKDCSRHIYTHYRGVCVCVCVQGCVCVQFCEVLQSLPQGRSGKKGHPTPHQHPNNLNSNGQLSKSRLVMGITLPAPHSSAPSAPGGCGTLKQERRA